MAFRINHLHLKTPDPKKTADFYVEYTGAKVLKENTRPDGSKNYRLDLHGVELNVTEFLTEQKLTQFYGLEHVAIDTNNFDGEVTKIKSAGLKILEERVLPTVGGFAFLKDPKGCAWSFWSGSNRPEEVWSNWSDGVLECWFPSHHCIIPVLHYSILFICLAAPSPRVHFLGTARASRGIL
jgi:Lactoylglutathione lyase and related lyases